MPQKTTLLTLVLILSMQLGYSQNSWKQFRGNEGSSAVKNVSIADKWPDNGPEKVWKHKLGAGFSELVVSDGFVYTMLSTYNADSTAGTEFIAAFDDASGKEIWRTEIDSLFIDVDGFGDGPRSTPVIDNEQVYCLSSFGKLSAHSLKNGKILWSFDLMKEFGSQAPRWAFSSSPIAVNDKIIIETGGQEEKGFTAFSKKTGEVVWSKGLGMTSYCSPIMVNIEDQQQIVFANDSMLTSFNENGEKLWDYRMPLRRPMASPLFIAPNKIFVSSVSRTGGFIVKIENNQATEIYTSTSMKNNWSSSCYYDGYIYGFSNATLKCVSAEDGTSKWSKRALGKGSLILVGDKLLVLSDKGVLKLVETNPEVYTELGSFQALEGKSWTAPSFANGRVYVRNLTEMASYDLK